MKFKSRAFVEEEGLKVLRARMTPVSLPDSVSRGYREKKKIERAARDFWREPDFC